MGLRAPVILGFVAAWAATAQAQPAPVPPPPVDLSVSQPAVSAERPKAGDTLGVRVDVTNLGVATSDPVQLCINLTVDGRDLGLTATAIIPALPAGVAWARELPVVVPAGRLLTVVAIADCAAQIPESNEANNLARTDVIIEAAPLQFLPQTLPEAVAGSAYTAQLVVSGGVLPYRFSTPAAPPGLTLEVDGRVVGVATVEGDFEFIVGLVDAEGTVARAPVRLAVRPFDLVMLPIELPDAVIGREYCATGPVQLRAAGGTPPYEWRADAIPAGLTLAPDGRLCGVALPPPVDGFIFAVVRDVESQSVSALLRIRIVEANTLTLDPIDLPAGFVGEPYDVQLTARAGTMPYVFSATGDALPPGLVLESSGRLHGTPTTITARNLTFAVRDARGDEATTLSTLVVLGAARPLLEETDAVGCGCGATGAGGPAWALVALAGAAAARRRRA